MKNMKKWMDPRLTQIALYVIATFLVLFFLFRVLDHSGKVIYTAARLVHWLGLILKPLLAGFAFAYILYPVSAGIERWLVRTKAFGSREGKAHSLAVAITWLMIAAGIFLMLSIVISALNRELRTIQVEDLVGFFSSLFSGSEKLLNQLGDWLEQMNVNSGDMQKVLNSINDILQKAAVLIGEKAAGSLSSVPGFLANLLFAVIFGIYFMLDAKGLTRYWDRVLRAVTGRRGYAGVHRFIKDADTVFSGYIRGQLIDAVLMCILISIALSVIGVPFAVIIGVMTGIGNLIPYVGPVVAYLCTILVCLIHFDLQKMIIAIIVIFIIQTIDGNVINPRLLSHSISVHPMLVIAALLVGSAIGGILGMLLSVPVAALIKIYFDRLIGYTLDKKMTRRAGQDQPAREKEEEE